MPAAVRSRMKAEALSSATQEGEAVLTDLPNFCDMAKTLGIAVE